MDTKCNTNNFKLAEIVSKFEMPAEKYIIKEHGEFGESEFYWVIENPKDCSKYLLVNTYSHHGVEKEMAFYGKNGFPKLEPVLRNIKTLEVVDDKDDDIYKYLFRTYSMFLIK